MLFIPLKQKYKKQQKGRAFNKVVTNRLALKYGQIGLKTIFSTKLTSKSLLTLYNSIKKKIRKKGRVLITVFPQTPITRKPIEVRMGKGKGSVSFWVAKVKAGTTICEISTKYLFLANKVLNRVRYKFPVKTRIVYRKF